MRNKCISKEIAGLWSGSYIVWTLDFVVRFGVLEEIGLEFRLLLRGG